MKSYRQEAMNAPTPGHYRVRNSVYVENDCGRTVADCAMDDNDELPNLRGITNANNARRISACLNACAGIANPEAVPDLLEACKEMTAAMENWRILLDKRSDELSKTIRYNSGLLAGQARAAIAKARGE